MKQKFSLSINQITNTMKNSKYQQHFHCFIVCIPVLSAFWFSNKQNVVTILISAVFRSVALIRWEVLIKSKHLFQFEHQKVPCLLEGSAYLRPGTPSRFYIYIYIYIYIYTHTRLLKAIAIFHLFYKTSSSYLNGNFIYRLKRHFQITNTLDN